MEKKQLRGFPITFNIYACDEQEVEHLRTAIVNFIDQHRLHGRAVTAEKTAQAISNWEKNPIVRNRVIEYYK